MLNILNKYTAFASRAKSLINYYTTQALVIFSFLPSYYKINDLMWQDGLLIDFLQKKVVDKWMRRFLVYSSYLFSERVMFEFVVRFYIDFIVWPSTKHAPFDFFNVATTLIGIIILLSFCVISFHLLHLYVLLF